MSEYEVKIGMTRIWTDGDKIVIQNPSGKHTVRTHVDKICGKGEFEKIKAAAYLESNDSYGKGGNPFARRYEMISGYIPPYLLDKIMEQKVNGLKEEDLINKYFKVDDEDTHT